MDRNLDRLHTGLSDLLAEAGELRGELRRHLDEDARESGLTDFDDLARRAAEVADALDGYEHAEARVIQESVTTDIGAGD
jgi:hypothetical protein